MIQLFFNLIKLIDVQKNVTIIYNEILNFFKISLKELMISTIEYILVFKIFLKKTNVDFLQTTK
ncbi:hypothetical protein F350042L8_13590 [Fusobacterium ulcerans]